MYNPFSLDGKTILITGASSGIGRATAIECTKMGAHVLLVARNVERLEETAVQCQPGSVTICPSTDLDSTIAIESLVTTVPKLDGLVNNAGTVKTSPINFIQEKDVYDILRVNTIGPILLTKGLLKKKKLGKGSSIVFTSSICGPYVGEIANSIYSISKGGINGFVKSAALELAPRQIRVNAICPGMTDTNILNSGLITETQYQEDIKRYPLGRHGKPIDIALGIVYLLSDASSWVTGSSLVIDGGMTIK